LCQPLTLPATPPRPLSRHRERAALERSHAAALEAAQHAAADERGAWREALAEKMKREAAGAERALRAALEKERDAELEVSGR
jgi:hypothetical protein